MNKPLFSIILLHYNQLSYVKDALDSIFIQNYENIELIFADDASYEFEPDEIAQYIDSNKKDNIKKINWQLNSENSGTVKTLNAAVQKCNGKYLLFFAADDQLYDENVLDNFYVNLEKADPDIYMISSQCHMMDVDMEEKQRDFVKPSFGIAFNKFSAKEQFGVFTKNCLMAMGATAMKMEMFEKYGYFDEKYKYIEDWPYFLHLTRQGGRIKYCNFNGLKHRDGGVSHYNDAVFTPPHVLGYKLDMVRMIENEMLPYISGFSTKDKSMLVNFYETEKAGYIKVGGDPGNISDKMVRKYLPSFYTKMTILKFKQRSPEYIRKAYERLKKFSVVLLIFFFIYKFILNFTFIKICLYALSFVIFALAVEILLVVIFKALLRVYGLIKKIRRAK